MTTSTASSGARAALLAANPLLGRATPSLFGGPPRLVAEPLAVVAHVDVDGSWSFAEGEPGSRVDALRLTRRPSLEPSSKAAFPFVVERPGPRAPFVLGARITGVSDVVDAFAQRLAAHLPAGGVVVRHTPTTPLGTTLDRFCTALGLRLAPLERVLTAARVRANAEHDPLIVVDAYDVHVLDHDRLTRVCGHGQDATLAAGLAPHIVARMLELVPEALELWTDGYDDTGRGLAIGVAERALLDGLARSSTVPLGGAVRPVFPPLSRARLTLSPPLRDEVEAAQREGRVDARLERLLQAMYVRATALGGMLSAALALTVDVKLPPLSSPAAWLAKQEGLVDIAMKARDRRVLILGQPSDPLRSFFLERGARVESVPPAWWLEDVELFADGPDPSTTLPTARASSVLTAAPTSPPGEMSSTAVNATAVSSTQVSTSMTSSGAEPSVTEMTRAPRGPDVPDAVDVPAERTEPEQARVRAPVPVPALRGHPVPPSNLAQPTRVISTVRPAVARTTSGNAVPRARAAMPVAFADPQQLVVRGTDSLSHVRVVVDGERLTAEEAGLELTGTLDGALVARLGREVRHGAVVCIEILEAEGDR
jgi:hypothetical protein